MLMYTNGISFDCFLLLLLFIGLLHPKTIMSIGICVFICQQAVQRHEMGVDVMKLLQRYCLLPVPLLAVELAALLARPCCHSANKKGG